jgi:hypothetical protein
LYIEEIVPISAEVSSQAVLVIFQLNLIVEILLKVARLIEFRCVLFSIKLIKHIKKAHHTLNCVSNKVPRIATCFLATGRVISGLPIG